MGRQAVLIPLPGASEAAHSTAPQPGGWMRGEMGTREGGA